MPFQKGWAARRSSERYAARKTTSNVRCRGIFRSEAPGILVRIASQLGSLVACILLGATVTAIGQEASPRVDQPFSVDASEMARLQAAIEPFVQMGRETFPSAKERYLAGLPMSYRFFVTTDLIDAANRMEQVFVLVSSIEGEMVTGLIANEIMFISDCKQGDDVSFSETRIKDWTIARPDGSEEGHFVGRFLDYYPA